MSVPIATAIELFESAWRVVWLVLERIRVDVAVGSLAQHVGQFFGHDWQIALAVTIEVAF